MSRGKETVDPFKSLEAISVLAWVALGIGLLTGRYQWAAAAFGLLFVGIFVKPLSRIIATWWFRFAEVIGAFNTRVILGLVYYLVLTPVAFVYRRCHQDGLNVKGKKGLWIERSHRYGPSDLEKLW